MSTEAFECIELPDLTYLKQPELVAERYEHLLAGWVAKEFEGNYLEAREEFAKAGEILVELLENHRMKPPFVAGVVFWTITKRERLYLKGATPKLVQVEGHELEEMRI